MVTLFAVIALLSFLLITRCTKREDGKSILYDDQYDDIRENVIDHDEEGAGMFEEIREGLLEMGDNSIYQERRR